MPRLWALLLILLLFIPGLYAQELPSEDQGDIEFDSDYANYRPSLYTMGDKIFTISLGTLFPVYFAGAVENNNHGIRPVGGTGSLAFSFFINSSVFLGGELSGMFLATRGGNMFYMVPIGARVGYQFIFRRFEFPITFMIGGAPTLYLETNHFGFFMKAGASAFFRFNPDWSFGLNAFWWFAPQWPKSEDGVRYNVYGNFVELTLSARYHF